MTALVVHTAEYLRKQELLRLEELTGQLSFLARCILMPLILLLMILSFPWPSTIYVALAFVALFLSIGLIIVIIDYRIGYLSTKE